jgi:hypothetical protein
MDDLRMASRVGVGHEKEVADSPIRTPPRKIRGRFHGYKHTSLIFMVDKSWRVRSSRLRKTILVTCVVTLGRR